MKKKRVKKDAALSFINWLRNRIRLLEMAKQHYEQNPTLMYNLKTANIEIIQSDLEVLKDILSAIMKVSGP